MTVTAGPDGTRARVTLSSGLLAPRLLNADVGCASVALVATSATLLAGDHVRVAVTVGAGVRLDLRDVAGTVAYDGRGAEALWDMTIRVDQGASLVWHGEPLVVSSGARVRRSLDAQVAEGGRLLLRDTVSLGRTGEAPGSLVCRTRMTYAGRPAYVEELTLDAESVGMPGMLAGHRVIDTVTVLGRRLDPLAAGGPAVLRLDQPGAIARDLVHDAHRSTAARAWHAWT
ncbi:hypothetical protein VV01_02720 [Luteipulveratus halotolerans]|uniref:Urease accessory protein UreD n=1 Tax=Luteipulveratus halotolerans TaxID=1631356 RepID=A0A0L6CNP8_9MICO|nr:hypothetical protein VV01_02720 [Luteipulveratus halotolerans]